MLKKIIFNCIIQSQAATNQVYHQSCNFCNVVGNYPPSIPHLEKSTKTLELYFLLFYLINRFSRTQFFLHPSFFYSS